MSGYSGKPLADKIGLKPGHRVRLLHAPSDFRETLAPIPAEVKFTTAADVDVAILFSRAEATLANEFAPVSAELRAGGMLWVAWPKRASGQATDLDENVVRRIGLAAGLVDVKVCAIDEVWSGLKFMRRTAKTGKTKPAAR